MEKGSCYSQWSDASQFIEELEYDIPEWENFPTDCIKDGRDVIISWKNGSSNLKYTIQLKNNYTNWGDLDFNLDTNTLVTIPKSFFIDDMTSLFGAPIAGKIEYRLKYSDNPSAKGSYEGILDAIEPFYYLIKPDQLKVIGYNYDTGSTVKTDYDGSYKLTGLDNLPYAGGMNNIPNGTDLVAEFNYNYVFGLEYDIEFFHRDGTYDATKFGNPTKWINGGVNVIGVQKNAIVDGWWKWKMRARIENEEGPCPITDWVEGPTNFEGNEDHDFCMIGSYPVGYFYTIVNNCVAIGNSDLTFAETYVVGMQRWHRILVYDQDPIIDVFNYVKACDWVYNSSYSDTEIDVVATCGMSIGDGYKYIVVETRIGQPTATTKAADPFYCASSYGTSTTPVLSPYVMGLEYVNVPFSFNIDCNGDGSLDQSFPAGNYIFQCSDDEPSNTLTGACNGNYAN